ncbi:HlyD family efflux transporter periplasmic adaptor subunit [uncultured Marivita sp.]|uniref:HlyD family secretion protein n=1 Tax=uncultured Marivita sp. TaxID=888080 RepID=UPI0026397080|nr:HlyD family efflux transporter periplasmic adaptor subunit [uncultured Marivita sp.]
MKQIWPILVIAVLGAAGAGAYWWQNAVASALPDGISASNGRIEAERIEIATRLAGRIAEVLVDEGDWVEAGDLIARMDTLELDAQLHAAQAAVRQAEQQELQAEALLRQRRSELVTAQAEFDRVAKLSDDGFFSEAQADAQRTVLETAQAAVAAAEAGISLAEATIAAAEASVERLQSLIDDASLTAPRAGRVQYVLAQEGEVLGAGGRVVTLTDLSDMYMSIFLSTGDAARLAIGDEARIILDAIPDYVIPATVTFVASTAQFTPRSVETADERTQLMFRVNLTIAPEILAEYQDRARAGVPGMGYVRVDQSIEWPDDLAVNLPQ